MVFPDDPSPGIRLRLQCQPRIIPGACFAPGESVSGICGQLERLSDSRPVRTKSTSSTERPTEASMKRTCCLTRTM